MDPFPGHSCLLTVWQPVIDKIIETPENHYLAHCSVRLRGHSELYSKMKKVHNVCAVNRISFHLCNLFLKSSVK